MGDVGDSGECSSANELIKVLFKIHFHQRKIKILKQRRSLKCTKWRASLKCGDAKQAITDNRAQYREVSRELRNAVEIDKKADLGNVAKRSKTEEGRKQISLQKLCRPKKSNLSHHTVVRDSSGNSFHDPTTVSKRLVSFLTDNARIFHTNLGNEAITDVPGALHAKLRNPRFLDIRKRMTLPSAA